jgi:hypothetical protein
VNRTVMLFNFHVTSLKRNCLFYTPSYSPLLGHEYISVPSEPKMIRRMMITSQEILSNKTGRTSGEWFPQARHLSWMVHLQHVW